MNTESTALAKVPWTWADQISTYRFWGLLAFYALSVAASSSVITILVFSLRDDFPIAMLRVAISVMTLTGIYGIYLGWVMARWKTKGMLYLFAILQIIGVLLYGTAAETGVVGLFLGAVCLGMGSGAVLVSIPALLAGGRGGVHDFVLAFGAVFTVSRIMQMLSPGVTGAFGYHNLIYGVGLPHSMAVIFVVVGIVFLVPVNRGLFNTPPPPRGRSFPPANRDPIAVALLMLIPLYNIYYLFYWIYKAHGEVAFLAPSRDLLSPSAAATMAVLFPFLSLMMLITLVDRLNIRASERGEPRLRSPFAVFLWFLFFSPVALGLMQSAINASTGSSKLAGAGNVSS